MGKRQKDWARRRRRFWIELLGGCCARCGKTAEQCELDGDPIEFDIIRPVNNSDHHRRMDSAWRMSFYNQQIRLNNVQLLCPPCNNKKHCHDDQDYYEESQENLPEIDFNHPDNPF